jgi:hypothetical protein
MADDQRHGRIFGVLFIITFLTSIPAYLIFESVLGDDPAGFIAGDGAMGWLYFAIVLEFFLVLSNVGTGVALYPIARRQNEGLAMGFVAARIIESVFIAVGIVFVLGLVTMRLEGLGTDDMATLLYELKDWTFLLGPGLIVPFGNGLILGYLMYRSGLVPRRMAWLGLIGGPIVFLSNLGIMFEWWERSTVMILVLPEAIWELFLGFYCTIFGFRRDSPIVRPNWRGNAAA